MGLPLKGHSAVSQVGETVGHQGKAGPVGGQGALAQRSRLGEQPRGLPKHCSPSWPHQEAVMRLPSAFSFHKVVFLGVGNTHIVVQQRNVSHRSPWPENNVFLTSVLWFIGM